MSGISGVLAVLMCIAGAPLAPGDHVRSVAAGTQPRPYLVHVPRSYDPAKPTPVVLALHPFATNGPMMARISGMSGTADREGFIVAYPNGKGSGVMLRWNVWAAAGDVDDDLGYLGRVLDDLEAVAHVDPKRVYATGFSNGGMMCYRLASELSGRIAAIAPVAGTMTFPESKAKRPVSVLHFHGTKDTFVTYEGRVWREPRGVGFKGVEETVRYWARFNGCPEPPISVEVPRAAADPLIVKRVAYDPGREGAEVVLYVIEGGGHTWPGRAPLGRFLGESAVDVKANDLIWKFFQGHPMP